MSGVAAMPPAPLWRRLGARLIDTVAVVALMGAYVGVTAGVPFLLFSLAAGGDFLTERQTSFDSLLFALYASLFVLAPVGLLVVFFAYEVVMTRRRGQTLGKLILGLRVVAFEDAGPAQLALRPLTVRWAILQVVPLAGFAVTLARLVAGINIDWSVEPVYISAIGAVCVVITALPLVVTESRRGVHDWVAGTVVVAAPTVWERPLRRGPGDEGFDRWQGFMRGGGSESGSGS